MLHKILIYLAITKFALCWHKETVLPGTEMLNYTIITGYLEVPSEKFLHFWFAKSEHDVENDPLIFWFNGGPMCSSLSGYIHGVGPIALNDEGYWYLNEYSWTKMASVVGIETPAGTGFSYAINDCKTDDNKTAKVNLAALKAFFVEFKEFRNHEVYITGESYAAVYITMLVDEYFSDQSGFRMNLGGIAIGNGILSYKTSLKMKVFFTEGFGLSGESDRKKIVECCKQCMEMCPTSSYVNMDDHCLDAADADGRAEDGAIHINSYDVYRDCFKPSDKRSEINENGICGSDAINDAENKSKKTKYRMQTAGVECTNTSTLVNYMNREDVRTALRIPKNVGKWRVCKSLYSTELKPYEYFVSMLVSDTTPYVRRILQNNVRILLFHGDTDLKCGPLLGQLFVKDLKIPLIKKKEPWYFYNSVAGFKTEYKGLTLLTFRGVGHMVVSWRTAECQYAIQKFIRNEFDKAALRPTVPEKLALLQGNTTNQSNMIMADLIVFVLLELWCKMPEKLSFILY